MLCFYQEDAASWVFVVAPLSGLTIAVEVAVVVICVRNSLEMCGDLMLECWGILHSIAEATRKPSIRSPSKRQPLY